MITHIYYIHVGNRIGSRSISVQINIGVVRTAATGVDSRAAAEEYLIDFFDGTGADAIPVYFREALPQVDPKEYPHKYKYVFETLINGAVEEMRRRLQESPIIRSLRHY